MKSRKKINPSRLTSEAALKNNQKEKSTSQGHSKSSKRKVLMADHQRGEGHQVRSLKKNSRKARQPNSQREDEERRLKRLTRHQVPTSHHPKIRGRKSNRRSQFKSESTHGGPSNLKRKRLNPRPSESSQLVKKLKRSRRPRLGAKGLLSRISHRLSTKKERMLLPLSPFTQSKETRLTSRSKKRRVKRKRSDG